MDAFEAIFERRSVRVFTDEMIDKDIVERIVKAGLASPSACNRRPFEMIVINNKEILSSLLLGRLESKPLLTAPLAIVVAVDTEKAIKRAPLYWACDASAATENILLAATSLGLGSLWLGVWPQEDKMESIKNALSLPPSIIPFSLIALGKVGDDGGEPMWKKTNLDEKIHWGKW